MLRSRALESCGRFCHSTRPRDRPRTAVVVEVPGTRAVCSLWVNIVSHSLEGTEIPAHGQKNLLWNSATLLEPKQFEGVSFP